MSVNNRGFTIDLGYPLTEHADLEDLYVHLYPQNELKCKNWLKDHNDHRALFMSGQIGTGKTTFLNYLFSQNDVQPDVSLVFDSDDFEKNAEGLLGYFYFQVMMTLIKKNIDTAQWTSGFPLHECIKPLE